MKYKKKIALSLATSLILVNSIYAKDIKSLDTVTVTAQKTEENIQKVPIAMSVFDETKIEDSKINDLTELTSHIPNLYVKGPNLVMRGISSSATILNTPVGLFVDDINYPMIFMQNPDLMDVERVEILRGPQGTLYGRNTEAGAINIITKKPDNEFRGKVFFETGIYDTPTDNPTFTRIGTSLSGPIIKDKLYMGLSLQSKDSDGYIENELKNDKKAGKIDHKTAKVNLRWTPTDETEVSLILNKVTNNDGTGYTRYLDGVSKSDRYTVKWDGGNETKKTNNGQALKIEHNTDDYNLVSITTSNDFKYHITNDGEFGSWTNPDQNFDFDNKAISQEFRVSSPKNNGNLEWIAGVYAFEDTNHVKADTRGKARYTDFKYKGYALFGQGTYTFDDNLHLTTGLRYDYRKSEGEYKASYLANSPFSKDMNSKDILPKVSLAYDFDDNKMGYATVSKGLLAGGYNYAFSTSNDNFAVDDETTWNYEIGAKISWLDNTLTLNGALFYIDIEDKQVPQWTSPTERGITNAGKAHSQGFELDMNAQINSNLNLFAGLGVVESKIDKWTDKGYDYKGKRLSGAPKYTYSMGFKYSTDKGYYTKADINGIDSVYSDSKNNTKIDGYSLVNLGFGYQGEDFDVALWGKNIFDKEYYNSKGTYWASSTIVGDGEPRTIGLTVSYYF